MWWSKYMPLEVSRVKVWSDSTTSLVLTGVANLWVSQRKPGLVHTWSLTRMILLLPVSGNLAMALFQLSWWIMTCLHRWRIWRDLSAKFTPQPEKQTYQLSDGKCTGPKLGRRDAATNSCSTATPYYTSKLHCHARQVICDPFPWPSCYWTKWLAAAIMVYLVRLSASAMASIAPTWQGIHMTVLMMKMMNKFGVMECVSKTAISLTFLRLWACYVCICLK